MSKVILIILDGLQYRVACSQMGFLHHLIEIERAARYRVKGELPSLSRPLYEVILTGIPCAANGITGNQIMRLSKKQSVFHLAKENGLRTAAAAYYWISELYNRSPFQYIEDREQNDENQAIQYGTFYFDDGYPDSHLFIDGELLRRNYDPDFLLIHPMGIDNAGHLHGSDSKAYRQKAAEADTQLAQLLPLWMEQEYHVLITSDHGMNRDGFHGGTSHEEREVPLFCISPLIKPGIYPNEISQLSIAPLLCKLLNIAPGKEMMDFEFPGLIL